MCVCVCVCVYFSIPDRKKVLYKIVDHTVPESVECFEMDTLFHPIFKCREMPCFCKTFAVKSRDSVKKP